MNYLNPAYFSPNKYTCEMNSLGFRGKEFDPNKKNILIAGCSKHFGDWIDDQCTFSNLLIQKLGEEYGYLNISYPGSCIELQLKNITWALSNFKFEKFLWLLPDTSRSIYYHEKIGVLHFHQGSLDDWFSTVPGKKWIEHRLYHEGDVLMRTVNQIELLFLLLKTLKLDSYVSSWEQELEKNLSSLRPKFNIKELPHFTKIDLATDIHYPGINSHSVYANKLYELIKP